MITTENIAKSRYTLKPRLQPNLSHAHFRGAKEPGGHLQPMPRQVLVRRLPENPRKTSVKMKGRKIGRRLGESIVSV
jgi:hypothetical protein